MSQDNAVVKVRSVKAEALNLVAQKAPLGALPPGTYQYAYRAIGDDWIGEINGITTPDGKFLWVTVDGTQSVQAVACFGKGIGHSGLKYCEFYRRINSEHPWNMVGGAGPVPPSFCCAFVDVRTGTESELRTPLVGRRVKISQGLATGFEGEIQFVDHKLIPGEARYAVLLDKPLQTETGLCGAIWVSQDDARVVPVMQDDEESSE